MKKFEVANKGYLFAGIFGVVVSFSFLWLNYSDGGKCTSAGRVGGSLCGNDNYIYGILIMIISLILISGGLKKMANKEDKK